MGGSSLCWRPRRFHSAMAAWMRESWRQTGWAAVPWVCISVVHFSSHLSSCMRHEGQKILRKQHNINIIMRLIEPFAHNRTKFEAMFVNSHTWAARVGQRIVPAYCPSGPPHRSGCLPCPADVDLKVSLPREATYCLYKPIRARSFRVAMWSSKMPLPWIVVETARDNQRA